MEFGVVEQETTFVTTFKEQKKSTKDRYFGARALADSA